MANQIPTERNLESLSEDRSQLLRLLLQKQKQSRSRIQPLPRVRNAGSFVAPLSYSQRRLWFIEQLEGSSQAYHLSGAVRLLGDLNRDALQRALDTIVSRHEVLRTTFQQQDDEPSQVVSFESSFALQVFDLSGRSPEEQAREIRMHTDAELRTPFNLQTGPLIRARLLRLAPNEHAFISTTHHIISDGWSGSVMLRELATLYAAYLQGRENPLLPLAIQYADYAHWQRSWLTGDVLNAQLDYWKRHLSGAPSLLELPTDRPRPTIRTYRGAHVVVDLEAALAQELKALARRHDVTLYMVLYTGFALLLSRLSGQADVVIGTPVANRQRTEVEPLIGFFVNTLALRVQMDDDPIVSELLERVKQLTLGGYANQEVPFEQVVEVLQPARSLNHSPVFQVVLTLQNTPQGELNLAGLTLAQQKVSTVSAQFDLTLALHEDRGSVRGNLTYATDLFDRATIERWVGHFKALLSGLARDTDQKISSLSLLSGTERNEIIHKLSAIQGSYVQDRLIHRQFEAQVARAPHAIALVHEEEQLTYQQLNDKANQLAHYLRELGVGPDVLVGLCFERSLDMIVAVLGILKAGGAYVPLDPAYPAQRMEYMLADAKPPVVLTQSSLEERLQLAATKVIALDRDWNDIATRSAENLLVPELTARHMAYVIYTSGSTGQPKGVMVEHRNVTRLFAATEHWFQFDEQQVWTLFHSIAFDFSVWELWGGLLYGGRVIVVPQLTARSPSAFYELLCRQGVTVLNQTPSAFVQLIAAQESAAPNLPKQALKTVIFGGEALELRSLRPWIARNGAVQPQLVNMYGITETTVHVTYRALTQSDIESQSGSIIGRPIPDLQVYLLDSNRQPVPIGVSGEIYVGGAGVARGYLNRAELTEQRFVADPFSDAPGARLYRAGDLARWRADGSLEYLGRNDQQVKIRGFRIELGEIEAQLSRLDHVRDAVVIARGEGASEKQLVAYVTRRDDETPRAQDMRRQLLTVLPEYMVPNAFVVLDALPLTTNGKLDRKALPAPDFSSLVVQEYEAPIGEIEQALAGIWSELLRVPRVGRHDNFFELGGHSLLAVRVITRIRQVLNRELALRDLFATPTLAGLAQSLQQAIASDVAPITRADRTKSLPLSLAQRRLWFISHLDGGGAAYHIAAGVRLRGTVDTGALKKALDTIVSRHEVLRTSFRQLDAEPEQVIDESSRFALQEFDVSASPEADREQELRRHTTEASRAPFDLNRGPLIRGRLIRIRDDEHVLLVTMHHIVSDGWSMGVLVREVASLYAAYREGRDNPLPPLPIQYADYAQWQRDWLSGEVLEQQLAYWKQHLSGAPELLQLPTDRSRPAVQSYRGGSVGVFLDSSLSEELRKLARRHDATLYMVLYAGFAVLLSRLSGQSDIVIGTPVANRQRTEVEALIGFFINTLAMRVQMEDEPSVGELLQRVKQLTLGGYAHQEVPFEQVVEVVQPPRSLSHSPIFQVMLTLQNTPQSDLELPGLKLSPIGVAGHTAQFDLTMTLHEDEQGVRGNLTYASDLFDRSTIDRWMGYFRTVLHEMARDSGQRIGSIELLDETERHDIVRGFNATQAAYPHTSTIHELIEAQARRTPDSMALVYEDESMTYAQLNAQANQLAHYLREHGVGPDQLVGLCVARGYPMVIGLLGILKAGGAYVPLDPSYPTQRLHYMVEDARPRVVLTQRSLRGRFGETSAKIIELDEHYEHIVQRSTDDLAPQMLGLTSAHLAYVIYTSGSTGEPKGVAAEHRSSVHRVWAQQGIAALGDAEVCCQKTTIGFVDSIFEMLVPLVYGRPLVIAAQDEVKDVRKLAQLIARRGVTRLVSVPSLARVLLTEAELLQGLQYWTLSGEALEAPLLKQLQQTLPRCCFVNLYGSSEVAADATCHIERQFAGERVPIGRPIANTQVYILDARGASVPIGVAGEIHIGGAGVARGYLHRDALTAERFLTDPFGSSGARMYRSGDLGRWRADGSIEYLGRNDHQVKLRGYRIELGEIESQLSRCNGVQQALVMAREDGGEKHLVAYLTGDALNTETIRTRLQAVMPEYMVPSAFVVLEQWPLTANGKIDRKALPAPDRSALSTREHEAPVGEIEHALAQIWSELLRVPRVGRHDNFFELGGHSLLAVQVVRRISNALAVELPLTALFEAPTLGQLSVRVEQRQRADLEAVFSGSEDASIQQLLQNVAALSEEDVASLLQQMKTGSVDVE